MATIQGPSNGYSLGDAIEAPANTKIHTDAVQAVGQAVLSEDEDKGAIVHSFDPDATTAQKAASVASTFASPKPIGNISGGPNETTSSFAGHPIQNALRSVPHLHVPHIPVPEPQALVVDYGSAQDGPKATVTKDDLRAIKAEEDGKEVARVQALKDGPATTGVEGAKAALAAVLPGGVSKSMVGWLDAAGGTTGTTLTDLSDPSAARSDTSKHPLGSFIDPEFYGSVFHNGAIIVFAILTTRVLTLLRLGWGWTILLGIGCASYYTLSMERTRARARDDIQRELVKVRLVTETETADWINSLLDRAWLIAEPLLAATIVASVDDAVKNLAVPGIESIKMTTFTLGNKAPRLDSVRTYPMTPDDEVIMEIALSFTPNDLEDLTQRQARRRVNPKIVLEVRIGVGIASKGLPILLEDIAFSGKLRLKLKLMSTFPHVQTVSMSFLEKPDFDYVLKPIGGERFGMDVNFIPGLSSFVKEQVHSNLGAMMYEPNVFSINLEQLLSGSPLDSAIGVLKVTIESARGLKATKIGGGAPDGYVTLSVGAKTHIIKTKTIAANANPTWSQSLPILVNKLTDVLTLSVFDYNEHRADSLLGTVGHDLAGLAQDAEQEGLIGKILNGGKDRGELRYSVSFYPVLGPTKAPDGVVTPPPDSSTGIVRLTIHQAKDLDLHNINGTISSFAQVLLGTNQIFRTSTIKSSNEPVFEASTEFLVVNKAKSAITVKLQDDRELSRRRLGEVTIKLMDLLDAKENGLDWLPLQGVRSGRLRMSALFKPLLVAGALDGGSNYVAPIGVMRLTLEKAVDVKNVEGALGGKSDPYVAVMLDNHLLARTDVVNNNLNPVWNDIVYVPVHSVRDRLLLAVMDYQNLTKDRSLGTVELPVRDYISTSPTDKTTHSSKGVQSRSDPIKQDRGFKGTLFYKAEFIPCVNLEGGVSFEGVSGTISSIAEGATAELQRKSSFASIRRGHRSTGSIGSAPSSQGEATLASPQLEVLKETEALVPATAQPENGTSDNFIAMSQEQLLASQSGILVIQAVSGVLGQRGRLEFLLDDSYWPFFGTEKARSTHNTWDQVGEGFVKELDFSRLRLRLNEHADGDKEDIFAELAIDTKQFLERTLNTQATFTLTGKQGEDRSTVTVSSRFIPVEVMLEPQESINDMGQLRVDLLSGTEIKGVDRSGKSDPFVTFTLDGQRVFKSAVQKKTLAPVWNEHFSASVLSRVAANLQVEVFDWNQLDSAKSLGTGVINLAALDPFQSTEVEVPLTTVKHGQHGSIRVRLLFQPEVIVRQRQNTSTFTAVGRTATHIGAVPLGVGKGVIHGGVGVVHKVEDVGAFAGRGLGFKKKDKTGKEILVKDMASPDTTTDFAGVPTSSAFTNNTMSDSASIASAGTRTPLARSNSRQSSHAGRSIFTRNGDGQHSTEGRGLLRVTVVRAKGLAARSDPKPYVTISVGKKSHKTGHSKHASDPEWNESFSFTVSATEQSALSILLFDHKTLGKDKQLGAASLDVQELTNEGEGSSRWVRLSDGAGEIELQFEYAEEAVNGKRVSTSDNGPKSPFKRR